MAMSTNQDKFVTEMEEKSSKYAEALERMAESDCWPTYSDGTKVKLGDKVISSVGPIAVESISFGKGGCTLWGYTDLVLVNDDKIKRGSQHLTIIDQVSSTGGWVNRAGEQVDYYSDSDLVLDDDGNVARITEDDVEFLDNFARVKSGCVLPEE